MKWLAAWPSLMIKAGRWSEGKIGQECPKYPGIAKCPKGFWSARTCKRPLSPVLAGTCSVAPACHYETAAIAAVFLK